jgi:adhesin transport system outer membrane protein
VRRAISEVQRLESDIQLQKSALSPRVDLRAEYVEGSLTQDISGSEKRIFVNISSQLGAGLSSLSNIQVANKTKQAARARVTSQRRLVEQIVRSDFSQAELFQLRVKSLTRSVDTAQQVADSYERQFPVGRKSWLDVMNAVRDLVNTEVQLADTKAAHLVVTWRLTIIARGLSHLLKKDFVDVNNEFSKEQNEK